jgi:uncharacterized membrane protein
MRKGNPSEASQAWISRIGTALNFLSIGEAVAIGIIQVTNIFPTPFCEVSTIFEK